MGHTKTLLRIANMINTYGSSHRSGCTWSLRLWDSDTCHGGSVTREYTLLDPNPRKLELQCKDKRILFTRFHQRMCC